MNFKHIKQMKQFTFYTLVGVLALSAVGCQDLAVENKNSPDRSVAFAQPGDVVNLISGTWTDYWAAVTVVWRGRCVLLFNAGG